eukprot:CAMPEP_0168585382 /NCGR_PEP_ID=MMETSP0420-20121227/3671_1 /TAXON_ID=498008 /ORGANISM="Pessonella sp." /LENGTH=158 /DNA_ID=CAMNT_0008620303 /DNA_START=38 /DNA_END=510 /DNA_ORIENTATION=+
MADEQPLSLDQIDTALIQLATGPRVSSSQFIQLSTSNSNDLDDDELNQKAASAAKALEAYTMAAAERAVRKAKRAEPVDGYQLRIRIVGHLFDRNVLNLLMDALVEAPSKFFVETIDVPQVNDLPTSVIVCVKSADDVQGEEARAQVTETVETIQAMV